jgi:aryl-alcohol dehydrogenase-like predicted oxidoreductase
MKSVVLGRSGLTVSQLAYGGGPLGGGMGHFDEQASVASVRRARELGITLFDTGRVYGRSEELLGRALADHLRSDRDEIVISTKGGVRASGSENPGDSGVSRDSRATALRSDLETSLATLGVDHIDLYQAHWPDPHVPLAETAAVLGALRDEGKIRHIGVSNFSAAQMAEFAQGTPAETLQPGYSMLHREPETDELPYAHEHDVGVLVYGPLAHGLLTGTAFDPATTFGEHDWRRNHGLFASPTMERNQAVVGRLDAFARERGHSVSQLALAWVLAQPAVHVAIVGTGKAAHLDAAVPALDVELTADDLTALDAILQDAVGLPLFQLEDM